MEVKGKFIWSEHTKPPTGFVSLQNAHVKSFVDDEKSWPKKGNLNLNGFTYDSFLHQEMYSAEQRLRWLNLMPSFFSGLQPYSQLIKIFQIAGYPEEAKKVAIEREYVKGKFLPPIRKVGATIWRLTTDYGYRPGKAVYFILATILLGSLIFELAVRSNLIVPTQSGSVYPSFYSLAYSVDVFFPILNLHQEESWMPITTTFWGNIVMNYMWFHIAIGWLLTTIFVAAVTGIVKSNKN